MKRIIVLTLTLAFLLYGSGTALASSNYVVSSGWGGLGSGISQFNYPIGITAVSGDIWVADTGNGRIQIFNGAGQYKSSIYIYGQPTRVTFDNRLGLVYVTVQLENKIYVLNTSGDVTKVINTTSMGLSSPLGIKPDKQSNYWVTFFGDMSLRKFSSNGALLKTCKYTLPGPQQPGLWYPTDLDFLADGTIALADSFNYRVLLINPNDCSVIREISVGAGPEEFDAAGAVAVDEDDLIYVGDNGNSKVQIFDRNGNYAGYLGSKGTALGQFENPYGLAFYLGKLYVVDGDLHKVTLFVDLNRPQSALTSYSLIAGDRKITASWAKNSLTSAVRVLVSTSGYAATPTPDAQHYQAYDGAANSFIITGLQPGTTYYVSAFTRDTNGRWSGPWNKAVRTHIIPNLTFACSKNGIACAKAVFSYGTWVNVYGSLKQPNGTPVAGKTVYIQRYSGGAWRYLLKSDGTKVTAKTNSYGKYLVGIKPVGRYGYRVYFPGGGGYTAKVSGTIVVTMKPVITIKNLYGTVEWGTKTRVTGYFKDSNGRPLKWQKLSLQRVVSVDGKWKWKKTLASTKTDKNGWYQFRWTADWDCRRTQYFRVVYSKDGKYYSSGVVSKYVKCSYK